MVASSLTLPTIDGDACVHALAPHASCRACVAACPAGAWLLDDEGLSLDTNRCDGCALCVPVCPRSAIALPLALTILQDRRGDGTAFAACSQAPAAGIPPIPCLYALGARDLDRLARDKITKLTTLSGECLRCERGDRMAAYGDAVAAHAAVRQSRSEPFVAVESAALQDFRRSHARALEGSERVDTNRRRLFGALLTPAAQSTAYPAAEPKTYVGPVIDFARCTACDACIRICPDGALSEGGTPPAYHIAPESCTGCSLCIDVCDQLAITVRPLPPAANLAVKLDPYRCRACGAPYYQIAGRTSAAGQLCRICARKNHHKTLFQVLKD